MLKYAIPEIVQINALWKMWQCDQTMVTKYKSPQMTDNINNEPLFQLGKRKQNPGGKYDTLLECV